MSVLERYPGRVPVVMVRHESCKAGVALDKEKYVVPVELAFGQFSYLLRKRLTLCSSEALFFFTEGKSLVGPTQTMGELHAQHRNADGYLMVVYTTENCFG